MSDERKLYRINRGSFTRRDGAPVAVVDAQGRKTGEMKAHVTYSAKTIANAAAKDEVYLTDREADLFGRHKLTPLLVREIKTIEAKKEKPSGTATTGDAELAKLITSLIRKGEKAKTPKEKRDFAKEVGNADIIDEVPDKHADILDALKELA